MCKIYKRGASLRFDTTLIDFSERSWQRGDLSFVYDASAADADDRLFIVDNKQHVYQRIKMDDTDKVSCICPISISRSSTTKSTCS